MEYYKNLSLENIEGEIWKDVIGYEGLYMISSYGRLKSLKRKIDITRGKFYYKLTINEKIRRLHINKDGYIRIDIWNKKQETTNVHILVAEAFIQNSYNKPCVNHIDGNKLNNCISNLEWCTIKENNQHANINGLIKRNYGIDHSGSRAVVQLSLSGEYINHFICAKYGAIATNSKRSDICNSCKNNKPNRKRWGKPAPATP